MKRHGELEPPGCSHIIKGNHTHGQCHQISQEHSHKNGCQLADSLSKIVKKQYNCQCGHSHQPVSGTPKILSPHTACHVVHRRRVQGQADGEYHSTCHQGRKQPCKLFVEQPHRNSCQSSHQLGPKYGGKVKSASQGDQQRYVGKAGSHDDRKAGTAEPP